MAGHDENSEPEPVAQEAPATAETEAVTEISEEVARARRAWDDAPEGSLIRSGHRVGDQLDASSWRVRERSAERLVAEATLPVAMQNYRGQLFGGFTGAYVDFVALALVRHEMSAIEKASMGLTTLNMRIDYFEPVHGPRFVLEAEILKKRGANYFIDVRFRGLDGLLLVAASVVLRRLKPATGSTLAPSPS
jgi:acyl-coenzyme A thioesterase PaaI-like protein